MKINLSKIKNSRIYFFIVLVTFIIYGNSINNEYSIDDNILVDGVEKVSKGVKEIPKIFTTYHIIDKNQSYGYRPLVAVSFAIEKQFFNNLPASQTKKEKKRKDKLTQANISHFINLLIYALTGIVLFSFLTLLFSDYNKLLPFLVTILFIIHPLHTEPVCNIKSRDELLMFLGMILSLFHFLKFSLSSTYKNLAYACLFVFLAFLSKKSTIVLVGIVPVVLYFSKVDLKKIIISTASILVFGIVMVAMKKGLVTGSGSREVKFFENPLLYQGDFMDRITVGLYCSWFYLKMLIFPKDMAYYYGFNVIPMANWSFYQVWLALIFYVPLGVYGFWRFIKRDILGLGVVLWFGVMLGVINVFFPIVGIVADRFTYVFSLGFCIVVAILLLRAFKVDLNKDSFQVKLPTGLVVVFTVIMIAYSSRVIVRNPDWHDKLTTFYHDMDVVDESAKAHAILANTLYAQVKKNPQDPKNNTYLQEIIMHYKKAIKIDSTYLTCYNNLGSTYIGIFDNKAGIYYCKKAVELDPEYLEANFNLAIAYDKSNKPIDALKYYLKVIEIDAEYMNAYGYLNTFLFKVGKVNEGIIYLEEIAKKSAKPKNIYVNIANLYASDLANTQLSILYFEKAFEADPTDQLIGGHLLKLYLSVGNHQKANKLSALLPKN